MLLVLLPTVAFSAQEESAPIGTAQRAYVVLARACSTCHGAQLRRPKGDFGFVLDLGRMSRSGEYVVRGRPDASGLMHVIEDGSMPPARSRVAALSEAELAALRDWILDGAPEGPIDRTAVEGVPEFEESSAASGYVGSLHPLLVHFPIALIVAAALAEIIFMLAEERRFQAAAEYCLLLGTVGGWAAGLSGWFFALDLDYTMTTHRWLGVATCLFALAACRLASRVRQLSAGEAPIRAYRATLFATIILLVISSHLGGTATWGDALFSG